MRRYFILVVLVVFGCALHGTAQEEPVPMPVIDCVVEYTHGDLGALGSVKGSDTITLDLNAVNKISLRFTTTDATRNSYVHTTPFKVESFSRPDEAYYVEKPDPFFWMKLVAEGPYRHQVAIYIRRLLPIVRYPQREYDITITTETETDSEHGFVDGFLVLKGTARN